MKKWQFILITAAVAVFSAGIGAYAATSYGTQSDPLITLSYLDGTLKPAMVSSFDSQLQKAMEQLENQFESDLSSATGAFKAVSLAKGQTLKCGEGTEILHRGGAAVSVGTLTDMSTGGALSAGGAMTANHLYICVGAGSGVTAGAACTMMVRGGYSVA